MKERRISADKERLIGVFIGVGILLASVLILSTKEYESDEERNVNNEVNHSYVDTTKKLVDEKTSYINEFNKRVETMSEKDKKNEFGYSSEGNFDWSQRIEEVMQPTDFEEHSLTRTNTDVDVQEKKRVERKQQLDAALYSAINYEATKDEISQFKEELLTNYTQDEYLNEIHLQEYSIPVEFKARVLENHAEEQGEEDLRAFANAMVTMINIGYEDANNLKADTIINYQTIMNKTSNKILAQKR